MSKVNDINDGSFETAILFLVFNRPETTLEVFDAIRKIKPARLYVASDGPRSNRPDEKGTVEHVRKIATAVDWPCEVKTLFRDENLGCKYAVSGAIDWFFQHEERGIILEDDCLPSHDFFHFCENMLTKYERDSRVLMITGTNYLSGKIQEPFYFSEHFTIWGWATWRRSWQLYDVEMPNWPSLRAAQELREKYGNIWTRKHFEYTFDALNSDYINTWDIQWVFTGIFNRMFCITPSRNLISNIGVFGTHGDGVTDSHFIPVQEFSRKDYCDYSPQVIQNFEYDLTLHLLKSKPAVKRKIAIKILKVFGIYRPLRSVFKWVKRYAK